MTDTGRDRSSVPTRSKVDRVIVERELGDLGERLEQLWHGDEDERYSLRALADYFNQQVLADAAEAVDARLIEGEVENLYRLLTDDESSARIQAETKLSRLGVDVEAVRRDFVTHQAIHTYLTKFKGIDPPGNSESVDQIEKRAETIEKLRNRLEAVTERSVEALRDGDDLSLEGFGVLVNVSVYCEACGRTYDVRELLEQLGCACDVSSD